MVELIDEILCTAYTDLYNHLLQEDLDISEIFIRVQTTIFKTTLKGLNPKSIDEIFDIF